MNVKKLLCGTLSCVMLMCCIGSAGAIQANNYKPMDEMSYSLVSTNAVVYKVDGFSMERATGSINVTLEPRELVAGSSFQMESGQIVTIKCTYAPTTASIDFGLLDPSGKFRYISGSNGSINASIQVNERGSYTFAIRNNSGRSVSVAGRINY